MSTKQLSVYLFLLGVPFICFLFIFFYFGLNIPFEDVIGLLRSVLIDIPNATSVSQKVTLIFHPNNEHPVIIFKLVIWVYRFVFSTINVKNIALMGNLIFLTSFLFFFRQLRLIKASWVWLIPIPYILLSLYSYENALWSLCSFQHTAIISFFLGGLFLCVLHKETSYKFYLGMFFLLCTSLSSGNGFLGYIIVFIILLFEKRFKSALIIGVFLSLIKYFVLNRLPFHNISAFKDFLRSFFILSGSIIHTSEKDFIIIILGVVLIICLSLFILYGFFAQHSREIRLYFILTSGVCLFAIGTFAGLSAFRTIDSSEFADRYRVYTHLLWISLYLFLVPFLIKSKFRKYFLRLAIVGGVLYISYSFYAVFPRVLVAYHQRLLISANYYHSNSCACGCSYRGFYDEIFTTLARRNIYHLPKPVYSFNGAENKPLTFPLKARNISPETLLLESETGNYSKDGDIFLLLTNSVKTSILVPVLNLRNNRFLRPEKAFFKGFRSELSKSCFPEDVYSISIATWKGKKLIISKSNFLFDSRK